jgi:hypothetical protein
MARDYFSPQQAIVRLLDDSVLGPSSSVCGANANNEAIERAKRESGVHWGSNAMAAGII